MPIASKLLDIKHSRLSENYKTFSLECFTIYGNKSVLIAVYIICVRNSFSSVAY